VKNILKNRKDEIVDNVGEDGIKKLQKVRLLRLIEPEIRKMTNYHTLGQILQSINIEFGLSISKTVFYGFCAKNIKKDEKSKTLKRDKIEVGVSKRDTKKEKVEILDDDELSAIAMYNSNSTKKD
jgi:hypothetical protein